MSGTRYNEYIHRPRTTMPRDVYRPPPPQPQDIYHGQHYTARTGPAYAPHGPPSPAISSDGGSLSNGLNGLRIESGFTMPSPPNSRKERSSSTGTSSSIPSTPAWSGQLLEIRGNMPVPVMSAQLETLYHSIARYILTQSDENTSQDELDTCCLHCKKKQSEPSLGSGLCPRRMSWFYKNNKVAVNSNGRSKHEESGQDDFLLKLFADKPVRISQFYASLRIPFNLTQTELNRMPHIPILSFTGAAHFLLRTFCAYPEVEFERLNELIKKAEITHPVSGQRYPALSKTSFPFPVMMREAPRHVFEMQEALNGNKRRNPTVEEVKDEFVPPHINRTETLLEEVHSASISDPGRASVGNGGLENLRQKFQFNRTASGIIQDDLGPPTLPDRERKPYSSNKPQVETTVPPREAVLGDPRSHAREQARERDREIQRERDRQHQALERERERERLESRRLSDRERDRRPHGIPHRDAPPPPPSRDNARTPVPRRNSLYNTPPPGQLYTHLPPHRPGSDRDFRSPPQTPIHHAPPPAPLHLHTAQVHHAHAHNQIMRTPLGSSSSGSGSWGASPREYFDDYSPEYEEEDLFEKESELGVRYYDPVPSPGPYLGGMGGGLGMVGGGVAGVGTGRGKPSPRERMGDKGWEGF